MPEKRLERTRDAYDGFVWPGQYVFECWCRRRYRRGDVVRSKCCLATMEKTPSLEWAENTAWRPLHMNAAEQIERRANFTTDRDPGDETTT